MASSQPGFPAAIEPEHPEVGILAFVPDQWSGVWNSRHQCLTRLAKQYRVVWLNPALGWRQQLKRRRPSPVFSFPLAGLPGFIVYDPPRFLPRMFRPAMLARLTFDLRVWQVARELRRLGCTKLVVYIWQPEFAPALDAISAALTCYHIVDEYSFSSVEVPTSREERRLIERVDQVIVHSSALMEKKGHSNPRTALLPNGVNYEQFAADWPEPADLRGIPHPRIGYLGRLKIQLDWPLLQSLATAHPEWSFVFIGAVSPHAEAERAVETIGRLSNVHLLGAKLSAEVPAYARHLDVGLMPYRHDDYTRYIYPLKLHEYLASGRPVVGTPIETLREFAGVVELPETPDKWAAAITRALSVPQQAPERARVRQEVARQHDWGVLVDRVAALIWKRLGEQEVRGGASESL